MPASAAPSDGHRYLEESEARLLSLAVESQRTDWVYATYITPDTEELSARAYARLARETVGRAKHMATVDAATLNPIDARKSKLLRLSLSLVTPSDPAESEELSRLIASMQGSFARGRHKVRGAGEPLDIQALSRRLAESRDPSELEDVWSGWHTVARPMRPPFSRYVELANRGARELGFPDMGSMWRSKYDLEPDAFAREVDRLWAQVRPLYVSLHAYVRRRLRETYGESLVPAGGPIPAHLMGNMWAQQWDPLFPIVRPTGPSDGFDLTSALAEKKVDSKEMVRYAERFFVSLGLDPLPGTFWERSLLERPRDREVVCHASAWDVDAEEDLRIKMCIETTADDFRVIHHELGHNYYQRAYRHQPYLFRDSAHDGFHEAVGDTVALSVTPSYLTQVGLAPGGAAAPDEVSTLLLRALEKVAFLPFGLLVDSWRWRVFAGEIAPESYNSTWWSMKVDLQGVAPPAPRGEEEFDPGAKYHVGANVPYMRYFLAHILQFQLHRGLLRAAGYSGPLHQGSIYGSKDAGARLRAMLMMGMSRPWPEALAAVTGEREMDGSAMLEYFAPLKSWLDEQNRGVPVGW